MGVRRVRPESERSGGRGKARYPVCAQNCRSSPTDLVRLSGRCPSETTKRRRSASRRHEQI